MRHVYWLVFMLVAACGDDPEIDFTATVMPVSTPEDTPATFAIEANLPASFQLTTAPTHGTVTGAGTAWTYTPEANYFGADTLTITATEGATVIELPVAIAVTAVNDAPVAEPDSFATNADNALPIDVASLLANDTDLEGDTLTITAASSAVSGGVVLAGDTITFTPTTGFAGTATFEYTLSDGTDTATGMVTVAVGVAQAITATDDTASTDEDVAFSIPIATLLANDIDPDGHTLSISELQNAVNCTVVQVGTEISVTPAPDANGTATFEYVVTDGALTDIATVTITINPVADAPVATADDATTPEDTPIQIPAATLLANDSDADNDTLTVTSVSGAGATLASNTITFAPAADFNGNATFQYTISDGTGGTATGTVTVAVTPVPDAPVANPDAMTIAEDGVASVDVLANDTDADGDTIIVASFTQPAHGVVNITDGVATYTPAGNFNGADAFTYTLDDGTGGTATGTVSITVTPVNDAPVAVDDTINVAEETPTVIPAAANDTDVDGDQLVVTVTTQPLHGTVQLVSGVITYTPAVNYVGPDGFDYTISDGKTGTDVGRVTINVTNVNDAPVANADVLGTDENTVVTGNVVANDTDVDGDTLTVQSNTQGAHGSVTFNGNIATYTPDTDFSGEDAFTYTISDGKGGTATGNVTVFVGLDNDPPVAVDDTVTVAEETPTTIDVLANDSDIDLNPLLVSAVTSAAHGTVSLVGGVVTYTPADNYFGPDGFDYVVSDGLGGSDIGHVTITVTNVNDAPVAVNDTLTTNEDTLATLNVILNDTDIDGDTLAIQSSTPPAHGTVVFTATVARYTPALNYNGPDSFTYTVTDGNGGTSTATVSITVNPVNDAPVAGDDARTVTEDTATVFSTLLGNDNDVDGDALSITAVGTAAHGTLARDNNTITYTPATNYFGPDAFDYTISDGKGGVDIGRVNITVTNVNDAPVAVNDALSTNEDTPKSLNVVTNDTDVDNDTLTLDSITQPATGGSVSSTGNTITFTPTANFNGSTSFTYVVRDPSNATSTGTVNVTVLAVNDAPIAGDDAITTNEDTPAVDVNVRVNDNDGDPELDQTLTITAVTQPANGAATTNGTTVTFTPAANFNGETSFTYTISDGNLTDTATVTVTVNPVNDPPVAGNDTLLTDEDTAKTINVVTGAPPAGDTDVDGDALTVSAVTQGSKGSVTFSGQTVTYTPNLNANGSDSFVYTISDGKGGSDTATVSVTITPENDPPSATNDALTTNEDTPGNVNLADNVSDPDGQTLTITASNGTNGSVSVTGLSATYTPNPNFNGSDSFSYTVSDGNGGTANATVTVTVTSVPDDPIGAADTFTTSEDTALANANVLTNDSDADTGDTLTAVVVTGPANAASFSLAANGAVTFVPAANFSGSTSFVYRAVDQTNRSSANVTATINVTGVNDPPIANASTEIVLAGDTKSFTLTGSDVEGQPLTFAVVSPPAGTLGAPIQLTPTSASVTYTAGFGAESDSFTFRVNDGTTNSTEVTVSITIDGCGNGVPAGGEECDDGNQTENDGCEPSCTFTCGSNGVDIIPSAVEIDQATGSCFARYDDLPSDYDQAITECRAIGGHLATVTSLTEHEAVLKVVETTEAWLGADDRIEETQFEWITGEDFDLFDGFENPPTDGDLNDCVATRGSGWFDAECIKPLPYVCEFFDEVTVGKCGDGITDPGEECDDGRDGDGDGCDDNCKFSCASGKGAKAVAVDTETDQCFAFFASDGSFQAAKELCAEKNGELATGVSSTEPQAMFRAIRQAGVPGGAWVAAIRAPEGFVWDDSSNELVQGNFLNQQEPDGTGDCLFANVLSSDGPQGWTDEKCDEPKSGTLCEYELDTEIDFEENLLQPFAPGSAAAIMIESLSRHGTLAEPGR